MDTFMLIIPDDYDSWAALTPEQRAAAYDRHEAFTARLGDGGHKVVGGAELTAPSTARRVRATATGIEVTDGPFAEAVEQISGFYLVESDNLADLEECCAIIATSSAVEIRRVGPAVDDSTSGGTTS